MYQTCTLLSRYQTGRVGKDGSAPEYLIDLPIDKDKFTYFPTIGYLVNVIVDPCRGHAHDCCMDQFGRATRSQNMF